MTSNRKRKSPGQKRGAGGDFPRAPRLQGGAAQGRSRSAAGAAPNLQVPAPETVFRDMDGAAHTFPESSLKRVAAALLTEKKKRWRYRPFAFPLQTQRSEQSLTFDFYIYDNMSQVSRVILLQARDSREVWDKVGRFKSQFPQYRHELWTPQHLADLQSGRARMEF